MSRVTDVQTSVNDSVTELNTAPSDDDVAKRFTGIDFVSTTFTVLFIFLMTCVCGGGWMDGGVGWWVGGCV